MLYGNGSRTMKMIFQFWVKEVPEGNGQIELPFNVELFCIENDSTLARLEARIKELEQNEIN